MNKYLALTAASGIGLLFSNSALAVVIGFDGGIATLQDGSTVVTNNTDLNSGIVNYVES